MPKYKPMRVPVEAYNNLVQKKSKMEEAIRNITKRNNISIPLTKVLTAITSNKISIRDEDLINLGVKGWRRRHKQN